MSKTIKARVSHGVIEPLEEINLLEGEVVTITIVKENEEVEIPPEDAISEELIESVKRSEEDIKDGRYIECKTKKESDAFFKKILDE